jgi:2-haloacid dehalogenase
VLKEWFGQVLQSALLSVVIGPYADFGKVGRAALRMAAERHGVTLSDEDVTAIVGGMRTLPPHPDVVPGLKKLKAAGFRMATLTNSPPQVAQAQIANAGLADYFEQLLSVDAVGSLKPAAKVYEHAAKSLNVALDDIRLVAAHSWDVAGAMRAGCRAAFVTRPGMVLDRRWDAPDIVGPTIDEVADAIIAKGG